MGHPLRVFHHFPDVFACSYYRARLPFRHCAGRLKERGVFVEGSMVYDHEQRYDAALFSRILRPEFLPQLEEMAARGTRIFVDCDDALFHIPEWSPARAELQQFLPTFSRQLELAERITVSTEPLREALGHPAKTDVLPNLIDLGDWRQYLPDMDDSTVRILWAGSRTHGADIERLTEAVDWLREDASVHVVFVGMVPKAFCSPLPPNITFLPGVPLCSYPSLVGLIRPHIALLPLVDETFNQAKSNIKFLEMTAAGAACVCDPVGPYAELAAKNLALGVKGDDWLSPIRELINDREHRHQLWSNSIAELDARWAWHSPRAEVWHDWYARQFAA